MSYRPNASPDKETPRPGESRKAELRLGLIGLDTSHVLRFAELLNDKKNPQRVDGGRIVAGFPGGSADFELSRTRVGEFTEAIKTRHEVAIEETPEAVAERVDALLLTSADGRTHPELFRRIAPFRKPVFLDKPFAVSTKDARAIAACAAEHHVPFFSSSATRFSPRLRAAIDDDEKGRVTGADFSGPMPLQDTQPGLFWYGIHAVEMLYAAFGPGCAEVRAFSRGDNELVLGFWNDGRVGAVRGSRSGNMEFCGVLHRKNGSQTVSNLRNCPEPFHRGLVEAALTFFHTGNTPVPAEETIEIVRFIEAANTSRAEDRMVPLQP